MGKILVDIRDGKYTLAALILSILVKMKVDKKIIKEIGRMLNLKFVYKTEGNGKEHKNCVATVEVVQNKSAEAANEKNQGIDEVLPRFKKFIQGLFNQREYA